MAGGEHACVEGETDMTEMKQGDSVRNRKRIIKASISPQKQRKQHQ